LCHEHSTQLLGPRDLFPIEHRWGEHEKRVCKRLVQPYTLQQVEDGLHEEWLALRIATANNYFFNNS